MEVAAKVHEFQVKQGPEIQKFLYQRFHHGAGMEGHQPPFIVLGNQTVLEEGMTFSVEPELFDPGHVFGYNPSDNFLVAKKKGVLMGRGPTRRSGCSSSFKQIERLFRPEKRELTVIKGLSWDRRPGDTHLVEFRRHVEKL